MTEDQAVTEINIKTGMPVVDEALRRFDAALAGARKSPCVIMKVIHGYGSSGPGGKIRTGLHRHLEALLRTGRIKAFVPGDRWDIFDAGARELLDICGDLRDDTDLGRFNRGVTLVRIR